MRRLPNAWHGLDPRAFDCALAAIAVVALGTEVAIFADGDAGELAVGAITCVAMATLALRRSRPVLVAIVIAAIGLFGAIAAPDVYTRMSTQFIAGMVAMYSVGRYATSVWPAVVVVFLLGAATIVTDSLEAPQQIAWLGVLGVGPLVIGRAVRNRARLQEQLRESTALLERDAARRADSAAEDERVRLAGELQAVIANGVSAIVVQAEAVPRVIAGGDADAAGTALGRIEDTGRETLAETRRLLGILRRDGEERCLAPQPTLAELPRLAEFAGERGLAVELDTDGEPGELAVGPDLAVYRVAQEALMDAVAVGARRATITVRYDADELHLEVRDDRVQTAIDPDRLLAMRERLGLYGGRVRAGVDERGDGFALVARLPLTGVPA